MLEAASADCLDLLSFPSEEFSEAVLKCLPPMPWVRSTRVMGFSAHNHAEPRFLQSIPDHEYETRRDMRKTRVFTIDPVRPSSRP